MEKAIEYLADEVLVEKHVVTYRHLSRALKLRVNAAKRALFEFHKSQNAKKPGSVHATYLLYGTKPAEKPSSRQHADNAESDVDMDDHYSEDETYSDPFPTVSMTVVTEGALEDALSKYETIEAIHVYSLSSEPMTDLQLLADSTHQLRELTSADVSDDSSKVYGTIHNPHVRRRQRKELVQKLVSRPSTSAKPASKPTPAPADAPGPASIWNKAAKSSVKEEAKSKPPEVAAGDAPGPKSIWNRVPKTKDEEKAEAADEPSPAASGTEAKKSSAAPAPKKASGGGIMQAFAKGAAAAKPKKAVAAAAPKEDEAMALSDDGGDDEDVEVLPKPQAVVRGGKSRKEREEELLKMMEEDDDEEKSEQDEEEREDTPMEDADEVSAEPSEPELPKKEEAAEVISANTGDGRRRGKRRVMRKKMIEDEGGYLVTIQEPGWESFSEDDAPPPKPVQPGKTAQPAKPAQPASQAPKAKKPAGQGSIMSFFSKK